MIRENIDTLIVYLLAIKTYAKEIHYNCSGKDFYSNHLFADKITANLEEYIDQLKEVCLLGHNFEVLYGSTYLYRAADIVPKGVYDFEILRQIMQQTLDLIETFKDLAKADENVIGTIAQDIQNNVGLINIMLMDFRR